jgi:hypothetical protein
VQKKLVELEEAGFGDTVGVIRKMQLFDPKERPIARQVFKSLDEAAGKWIMGGMESNKAEQRA